MLTLDLVERFVMYLDEDANGCWLWTRYIKNHGYGAIWDGERSRNTHVVAWELWRGPVPPGLELDHLCRVRHCCNPDHLEPVTHLENVRRGLLFRAQVTQCYRGHPYDEANTFVGADGRRHCRECDRMSHREGKRRRRQVAKAEHEPFEGETPETVGAVMEARAAKIGAKAK